MKKSRQFWKTDKEGFFLRKDDQGKDLFYPWGYPGEAFYIDEIQQKWLNVALFFLRVVIFLFLLFLFFSGAIFKLAFFLLTLLYTFGYPFYIVCLYFANSLLRPHIVSKPERLKRKPILFLTTLISLGAHLALFLIALYTGMTLVPYPGINAITYMLISCPVIIFLAYFLMKLYRTKGYFFNA